MHGRLHARPNVALARCPMPRWRGCDKRVMSCATSSPTSPASRWDTRRTRAPSATGNHGRLLTSRTVRPDDLRGGGTGTRETIPLDPAMTVDRDRSVLPVRRKFRLRPRRRGRWRAGRICASRAADAVGIGAAPPSFPARSASTCSTAATRTGPVYLRSANTGYAAAAPPAAARIFRARQRRSLDWRDHAQFQGRDRLGVGADRATASRWGRSAGPNAAAVSLSGTTAFRVALFQPKPSSAAAVRRRSRRRPTSPSAPKAGRGRTPPSPSSPPTRKLTKAQANRLAVMAQTGLARSIYPVHTPLDGDVVFAAATGRTSRSPTRPTA